MLQQVLYICKIVKYIYTLLASAIITTSACTSQKIVKPLEKGQQQVSANLGGPLIGFGGLTIPVPLTSVNYARGITDSLTIHGSLQTTSLIYKTIQLDAGATYGILQPKGWKPGLSVSGSLNVLTDMREGNARLYPQLDANLYWEYGSDNFMYLGSTNWIELVGTKAHEQTQEKRILSGIQFGNTWVTPKWSFTAESKWLAPTRSSLYSVVDYKSYSLAGEPRGAVGIYFGIARRF
jgi:hypothetical protein